MAAALVTEPMEAVMVAEPAALPAVNRPVLEILP